MRILILVLLLVGCSRADAPAPPVTPLATPTPAPSPAASLDMEAARQAFLDVMHERLLALEEVEHAVVRGDVEAARAAARGVNIEQLRRDLPADWQPRVDALVSALAQVAADGDLASVARGAAQSAAACGSCHKQAEAGLTFSRAGHPGREPGAVAHMARHREAAALMREALISADDARWSSAMTWLAQGPMEGEELPSGYTLDATAREWEARVHALAAQGQAAPDAAARAAVYGDALVACASCHEHTGGGPSK